MNEDIFLSFINKKYFASNTSSSLDKKELDDREKVILYTLIAARAFSKDSCADLKAKDTVKDKWLELLERSYDNLVSLRVITKLSKADFLLKTGNEHLLVVFLDTMVACFKKHLEFTLIRVNINIF